MLKQFKSILVILSTFSMILAQSGSISGSVTDENGNGLPGANLIVDGTS